MVALRKAGAYSKKYTRPYTRYSKKKNKNYIKTVPQRKTVKFNMGNFSDYNSGKYDTIIKVIAKEDVQIRDNAIEAARQTITRHLDNLIPGQYYFEVKIFPHHILRENKMLTGAGSDRMQTGMQKSFGKTIGRAALTKQNSIIFLIATKGQKQINAVRSALNSAKAKLPCKVGIGIEFKK